MLFMRSSFLLAASPFLRGGVQSFYTTGILLLVLGVCAPSVVGVDVGVVVELARFARAYGMDFSRLDRLSSL